MCITLLHVDALRCRLRSIDERSAKAVAERRKKTTRLTVSLDEADYAALNTMATRSDVSLSWVIRQAIHRFIREYGAQPELPLTLAGPADKKEALG